MGPEAIVRGKSLSSLTEGAAAPPSRGRGQGRLEALGAEGRSMFDIVRTRVLAPDIKLFEIRAPRIASKQRAGQFVILRLYDRGERIPLTIAGADPAAGHDHDRRPGHRKDDEAPQSPRAGRPDPRRRRAPRKALGGRPLRHRRGDRRRRGHGDRLSHRPRDEAGGKPRDLHRGGPHSGARDPRGGGEGGQRRDLRDDGRRHVR